MPLRYEADSVWLWALRRVHCDAHDFLQRHRCAIAIGVCASLWWTLVAKAFFAKAHLGPSPGKGKGPFGRAGLRENLRPGGEPGLTQGGGVRCLILGGAPVRTALGWQANWEGDPAFARQKYRYGFSRSCETVLNDLCTQGTCARQDVKGLMGAIKQHLT